MINSFLVKDFRVYMISFGNFRLAPQTLSDCDPTQCSFFLLHEYVVLRHCQIYDVAVLTLPHGKGEQPSFHYESMQLLLNAFESINLIGRIFITKA